MDRTQTWRARRSYDAAMNPAIVLVAPDKDWSRTLSEMAPVYEHFEPKDD